MNTYCVTLVIVMSSALLIIHKTDASKFGKLKGKEYFYNITVLGLIPLSLLFFGDLTLDLQEDFSSRKVPHHLRAVTHVSLKHYLSQSCAEIWEYY